MYYSADFAERGLPLVVHCEWTAFKEGRLWICSSKEHVRGLLNGTAIEGHEELAKLLDVPPEVSENPLIAITGDMAQTMGADIVALVNDGVEISTLSDNSDLSAFKLPPATRPPGEMLLAWVDQEVDYHAVIARSRQQAASVVRSLADWMPSSRRKTLLRQIAVANMPDRSGEPPYRIEGKPAELIHWASLWSRMRTAIG